MDEHVKTPELATAPIDVQNLETGSEGWLGADRYDGDDSYHIAALEFFQSVKWEALLAVASRHRSGLECHFLEKFSIGDYNMVRRLIFEDGVSWVARVRLPAAASPAPIDSYDSRRIFEIEFATALFLKTRTNIPTAEIFLYDSNPENSTGVAYMLMEYIHGTTASEMYRRKIDENDENPSRLYGTPDQDRRFREQVAKIQAEMMSITFPEIGSLYYDKETSAFGIGPDHEMGKGPWTSSSDYYRDLADYTLKHAAPYPRMIAASSFPLPVLINHLLGIYGEEPKGPFRLVNEDFGDNNILVDDDFNIVGIIDLDSVMSAPVEAVAQYPFIKGLSVDPPNTEETETRSAVLRRIRRDKPLLAEYKELLIKAETNHVEMLRSRSPAIASRLGSLYSLFFNGMMTYRAAGSSSAKENWYSLTLKVLERHVKGEL